MDIQSFRQFSRSHFGLEQYTQHLADSRPRPQIKAKTIFEAVFYMGILGLGALLRLDQFVRTSKGKRLFGISKPLVSDSTLSRSLSGMELAKLHHILQSVYAKARQMDIRRCEIGKARWRIGLIDGSTFGRFMASCFAEMGSVCLMGDLEAIPKPGKELPSSERLLRTLCARFGPRWVDLILLDGLYVAQGFLRICLKECAIDFLIKTQEERLTILQDAMGMFQHYEDYSQDIQYVQGTDAQRMVDYQVYALDGFFLEGVDAPLKVAWIQEENLRTGAHTEFWAITSCQQLTATDMRELAHWRWDVENKGFKTLNALVHTKHIYAHHPHAQQAITLILAIAGNLLQLFLTQITPKLIEACFGKLKCTQRFLQQQLCDSLMLLPAPDT